MAEPFVPDDFEVPTTLVADRFVLEPLGPEHNESDYAAWSSSLEHVRATPGFDDWRWPYPMPLAENLSDLEKHALEFRERTGFTYTVLDGRDRSVVGCVYILPPARADGGTPTGDYDASVRSWVRADRSELDRPLWEAVSAWLAEAWPFERVRYASRD